MCVLNSSTNLPEIFLVIGRFEQDITTNEMNLYAKYMLFLTVYNKFPNISSGFRKNPQRLDFMKIRPVGTEVFHADRPTHDTHEKANRHFSQFCERA